MRRFIRILTVITVTISAIPASLALDRRLEARFTDELKNHITAGEAIDLQVNDHFFLGIYIAALTPRSRGGIVLLHHLGGNADWPEVITPIRAELPKYGWNTLSIQLPLLSNESSETDQNAFITEGTLRIKAAINYLNSKGIYNVLIIGQGMGAAIGLTYLTEHKGKKGGVTGFIGLSMYHLSHTPSANQLTAILKDMRIPMLDVYGSLDIEPVMKGIAERRDISQKLGIKNYQQLQLIGADYRYTGIETTLVKRIKSWIDRHAPSFEINVGG